MSVRVPSRCENLERAPDARYGRSRMADLPATMWRTLAVTLLFALNACGGGGGETTTAPGSPTASINTSAELAPSVKKLTASDPGIVSEAAGGVVFAGDPHLAVGQIILTQRTAIKITRVAQQADGTFALEGTVPDISEVFNKLSIGLSNLNLQPSDFTPAEGVTVLGDIKTALSAKPQAGTSNALSLSVERPVSGGKLKLALTVSPSVNLQMDHSTLEAIHAIVDFKTDFDIKPSYSLSLPGPAPKEWKFELGSYRVNVPVAAFPAPYFVAVKVPVNLVLSATAGKTTLTVGANARTSFGFRGDIHSDFDTPSTMQATGTPWTVTPAGSDIVAVDADIGFEVKGYVQTGLSLSLFFGTSEPMAALVNVGLKGDGKLLSTSTTDFQFNLLCVRAGIKFFSEGLIRVKGLADTKASLGTDVPLFDYTPASICGTNTFTRSFRLGDNSDESYLIKNGVVSGSRVRQVPGTSERISMSISGTVSPAPAGDPNMAFYVGTGTYTYTDGNGKTAPSISFTAIGWLGPNGRFSWEALNTSPYRYGNIGGLACTTAVC